MYNRSESLKRNAMNLIYFFAICSALKEDVDDDNNRIITKDAGHHACITNDFGRAGWRLYAGG